MLRRILATALGSVLIVGASSASALAAEEDCVIVTMPDGSIERTCDEDQDDQGGGGGDGDGDGGNSSCTFQGNEIPCSTEFGTWDGISDYRRVADPQPPAGSSYWEGHEPGDGVIVEATPYECAINGTGCGGQRLEWSPDAPAAPQVSAERLANQAFAQMNLTMGNIGSTPPSSAANPDSMGQLGLPIWLWVTNPGPNTTGPNNQSASAGALVVNVTATLDRTEWHISRNGQDVAMTTCRGANAAGTAYDGRDPELPPPCGFPASFNTNVGNLTITGTAYWTVTWTATNGEQGTIPVTPPSNTTQIRIGETQAILD